MAGQQKVIWRKKAFQMLLDIAEYLAETIGQEKANIFVNELTAKTDKLKENPEFYPPCRFQRLQENNFRCMHYKKYIVIYRQEDDEIRIYGVIYEKRNPNVFNDLAK